MTRAEAIELAASALWANGNARYMETVRYMKWPEPDPLPTWASCDDTSRAAYIEEATAAVDALLEAGMTFGEEWQCVGVLSAQRRLLSPDVPRRDGDLLVFVHRPQGESK